MKTSQKKMVFAPPKGLATVIFAVIQIYPIPYVFSSGPKTQEGFRKLPSYVLPPSLQLADYKRVLEANPIVTYFKNSFIILVFILAVLLVISSIAGFTLARIRPRRDQLMLNYFTLGLMLPCQVALIPLFTILNKMGLLNAHAAIMLPQMASVLSYFIQLFYSFSRSVSNETTEATIINGCSPLRNCVRTVCPISTNSPLTVGSIRTVFCWNDFIQTNTFIRSSGMKTVTLGISDFVGYMGVMDQGLTFATTILITISIFIIYFLTSKYMLARMTVGAIKGQSVFENLSPPSARPTSRVIWAKFSQHSPLCRLHLARTPRRL